MLSWFGNLKTMWKLMVGFALMGAIMCVLGWIASQGLQSLRDSLLVVYEDYTVASVELAHASTDLMRYRNNIIQATGAPDQETYTKFKNQQPDLKAKTLKSLEIFAAKPLRVSKSGRDEAKDLQTFREAMAAYYPAAELSMSLAGEIWHAQSKLEADALREKAKANVTQNAGPKLITAMNALDQLLGTVSDVAKDMNENGRAAAANGLLTLAVGTAAAIMLGLLMGWLIARFLARNLADVITAAQGLGSGDLTARSVVTTQDEVGQLAQAFNNMGENLQAASAKQQEMATSALAAAAEIKGITDAISKGQAVIEFNLDGTVITANDNFLGCLGYSLPDIQGQHHRMFCESTYAASGDYQAFWSQLNRGEFAAGTYRRLGKGGTEVWIQATYNPIMDANGKPYKVVKYAMDVTTQKNIAAEFEGKIAAINKGQAVIEFNLDGTVLTANDNFLNCLGYTLGEIKGQHHRLFCERAYASSGEYVSFWQKLNRGEFDAGAYKRIGKGGEEIWIQASYNPILDLNGKPYKIVKFATDITAQKKSQVEQEQLVGEAQHVLSALADGDLTQPMVGIYQGELEQLKGSINRALTNLTATLATVWTAAESVSTGAEQITKGNEDLSQRTSEQASSLEETSSAMEEMTSTVKQNAENAKQANQLAIAARDVAEKGGSVTTKAIDAMEEINKSSKKIADIITVIDEIAFQTNLLALNAAVEAARAGEHGRGFAVVAAEVRNLAQRSATAAKEIKGLINESVQRVTDGSDLVDQSGKTLTEIVGSVKRVTDIIAEISAASQEQASGIDQVNKAIMQMDETTQQNAALVEEATSASQSMKEQARELMNQVASFKLTQSGQEPSQRSSVAAHKPSALSAGSVKKSLFKKPVTPSKVDGHRESVTVAAGNGKDRCQKENEFEEF